MADKAIEKEITVCERQLYSIYTHFGQFLYENIENEGLSYCFESGNDALEEKAKGLLSKLKNSPTSKSKKEVPTTQSVNKRGYLEPYVQINADIYIIKEKIFTLKNETQSHLSTATSRLLDLNNTKTENNFNKLKEIEEAMILSLNEKMEVVKDIMKKKKTAIENIKNITSSDLIPSKTEKEFLNKASEDIKNNTSSLNTFIDQAQGLFQEIKSCYEKELKEQSILNTPTSSDESEEMEIETEEGIEILEEEEEEQNEETQTPSVIIPELEDLESFVPPMDIKSIDSALDEESPESVLNDETLTSDQDEEENEDDESFDSVQEGELVEPLIEPPPESSVNQTAVPLFSQISQETNEEEQEEDLEEENLEEADAFDRGLAETAYRKLSDDHVKEDEKLEILNTLFHAMPGSVAGLLYELTKDADLILKKQLINLFTKIEDMVIIDVYKKFVQDEQSFLRLHGIMGLSKWKSDEAKKAIITAVHDPNHVIRRLVANCLSCTGSDIEMTGIVRLVNDDDENVARIAIRKLGKGRNRFSFINLIPKLESPNIKIRKEAIEALQSMTGITLNYRYKATERERNQAVKRWQKLWIQNKTNPHFLQKGYGESLLIETKIDRKIKIKQILKKKSISRQNVKKPVSKNIRKRRGIHG